VDTSHNFAEREEEVLAFWRENRVFERSVDEKNNNAPVYTFYDGPPTANGKPHIGHVLTRAVKDAIPRYKTMKGYKVLRKAGWDTHGLPVELEVEKQLGISGKPDIEVYGIEPFIQKCKESVWGYESLWKEMSERVAFWADMENPYVTYKNEYIESVWWALSEIWKQNLIYKGYRVVPYCPRCGTPLSSHEVSQGYKEVKEKSVIAKFKVRGENAHFLAWTTTPWTLPSNVALCVNPKEEYIFAEIGNDTFILAKALADTVLKPEEGEKYTITKILTGKELVGMEYEPLLPFAKSLLNTSEKYCTVAADNYVTLTDGTGIVHMAPAFGEDDARVCKDFGLPFVNSVNEQGRFVTEITPWAGMFVKDADPKIIAYLTENDLMFEALDYTHNYPFCWRCNTPLIYYARDAWFIKMTDLRENLLKNNDMIEWLPDNIRTGRFGNFLENVIDWSISRERYWGTPLPIWECECGYRHCIGGVAELREMAKNTFPENIELHKPYIDQVLLSCPKCKGEMHRVPEVIDCWFDSGSMPFAQWHYPFENRELFEQNFPADFISEAIDQTRGWFYSLHAISTLLFKKPAFVNCIVMGHVQDAEGRKLSKSLGNYVDPMESLLKHGADAIRWYFYTSSAPWLNTRYSDDAVEEAKRKFMVTLWNSYAFYVLYANIDKFNPTEHTLNFDKLQTMDRWILSRLHSLIKRVDTSLESYEITEPTRALTQFVDDLSNWYVRRSRERFWASGMEDDKIQAFMTLHYVLMQTAKLAAPFTPFMSEQIYRNLITGDEKAPISVHLSDFPRYDDAVVDLALEKSMEETLNIVSLGRAARNISGMKNRQPLSEMIVGVEQTDQISADAVIIAEELNIKTVRFAPLKELEAYISYKFKPQLRTLGPKYGKLVPKITEALNQNADTNMKALQQGILQLTIENTNVELTESDVLIETVQQPGYAVQSERNISVAIKTTLTPDLIEEGYVRELVSKIQTMRKEAGFEVMDKITLLHSQNPVLDPIFAKNSELIATEVLANEIKHSTINVENVGYYTKEWQINDQKIELSVKKT